MSTTRQANYPIDEQFISRWSSRAFDAQEINDQTLFSFFEAARWAPSAFNIQPWRFTYTKRNGTSWQQYLQFLNDFNRQWAQYAAALIIVFSRKETLVTEQLVSNPTHSFDTGAAWLSFALQAHNKGWVAHGMTGIEKDRIIEAFNLPESYAVEAMVAVGKRGRLDQLPEMMRGNEAPSPRKPITEFVFEGLELPLD